MRATLPVPFWLYASNPFLSAQEVRNEVTFFPWHSTAGFISQAANLLLLRVMAWRRTVPQNARFLALDVEGKLCYCTYVRDFPGPGGGDLAWGKLEGAGEC